MINHALIKVLTLDDDPYILKLMGAMLRKLGFTQVTSFENGHAALAGMAQSPGGPPDIILMDLNMPEMDGIEFVRHLVDRAYAGSLILVSGEDERMLETAEALIRAHRMSVLGRLQKPVAQHTLAAMMARWSPPQGAVAAAAAARYTASDLAAAIDQGQLFNCYQPQVSVATGQVLGVESLVRWHHPLNGVVPPDQFIGLAEEHGLIDALTRVVIPHALAQLAAWRTLNLQLRMSINVSMFNLESLDFPDYVAQQALVAQVPARDVTLEITESRLLADLRAPLEILTRLRLKRFGLSIDDFGTGHSSLSQLKEFPFDELKVDRSFVHDAAHVDTTRAIYEASLGLARQLNMVSVAEGVENRADWDFLRRTGCQVAQGYFIARPMSAVELPDWIKAWERRLADEALVDEHHPRRTP